MLERVVFSEDKRCMGMMHQNKRSLQARPVIVCRNGASAAAAALDPERRPENQRPRITTSSRITKRNLRTRIHPLKYMLLKTLKKESKVRKTFTCYSLCSKIILYVVKYTKAIISDQIFMTICKNLLHPAYHNLLNMCCRN